MKLYLYPAVLSALVLAGCDTAPTNPGVAAQAPASEIGAPASYPPPIDLGVGGSKPVSFSKVVVSMPADAEIGKVTGGLLNIRWSTLRAVPGEGPKQYSNIATDELKRANYTVVGDPTALFENPAVTARYQVGAQITWMQLDLHLQVGWTVPTVTSNGATTVVWQVFDTQTKQVVFKRSVDSSFHAVSKGDTGEPPIFAMFRVSTRHFLADPDFAAFMRAGADAPASK